MKLIVGLGNPGKAYENSRHNAGFLAVDAFAKDAAWTEDAKRHAIVGKTTADGETVVLAKPTTFMNLSGEAVQALASYYKIDPSDILVIQDEMDLPPGELRFSLDGNAAGHHGIESIYGLLGNDHEKISRLRIGIGRPNGPIPTEDWVLGTIDPATLETAERAADAVSDWITDGLEKAMNVWNRKE